MQAQCQSHQILVVDDDRGIREVMREFLEDEGYCVASAANGQEAINWLRTGGKRPCLILLDLNMPVMTGWEFLRVQQVEPRLAQIPVVVFSADQSIKHEASSIDPAAYLLKPIDFLDLVELVERFCGAHS